jgi:hypothetical protein
MTIPAYPLQWPEGWKRTDVARRSRAKFGRRTQSSYGSWKVLANLTVAQACERVRDELERMGIRDDDLVVSSNVRLRLDGLPRSGEPEPADPGAAVYWRAGEAMRCMAIDRYDRVADNLAAIAATLEAMRAIERHGGAEILNRAFTGFAALADESSESWWVVLGVEQDALLCDIEAAYRRLRSKYHPDKGGDADQFMRIQRAYERATR